MKELSIEEKARRYDEALERFDVILNLNTVKESGTVFVDDVRKIFPELKESEDERIRRRIIHALHGDVLEMSEIKESVAWLEKQGEQKPTQEIEPFEAEHGKYYYCIKDYFCGGRKQASKGDVVQALRGLPIMGLKDASEYFLPVNSIKYKEESTEVKL